MCCMCESAHGSPLSLAVDGSSKAICSASSDRESSTGRALRRVMDSRRLIIFILSIFSAATPGPTGLMKESEQEQKRKRERVNHYDYHQKHLKHCNHSHFSFNTTINSQIHTTLLTFSVYSETTAVQPLRIFQSSLGSPRDCVCSRSVCSHCYVSPVQTWQDKKTKNERRKPRGQRVREKQNNKQ